MTKYTNDCVKNKIIAFKLYTEENNRDVDTLYWLAEGFGVYDDPPPDEIEEAGICFREYLDVMQSAYYDLADLAEKGDFKAISKYVEIYTETDEFRETDHDTSEIDHLLQIIIDNKDHIEFQGLYNGLICDLGLDEEE